MRVVHLVIGGDVAGGQVVALRLARAARDAGHDVFFIAPEQGPFTVAVEAEGMRVYVLPIRSAFDVRAVVALCRMLRGERVDVLHTHVHFSAGVVARLGGRIGGACVIAHMHIENAYRTGRGRSAQVLLDNATARLCRWIVAVSEATAASLVAQGYPRDRIVTVHNGIEDVELAVPAELPVPPGAPVLGEVARLCAVKGQRDLLGALPRLQRQDVAVVLVGKDLETNGVFEKQLRVEAERFGDRVLFAGYRADVPAVLAALDIVVLPSWIEGLPLVLLEAMAQAKPVVATDVGGTAELVAHNETGLLVAPRDPAALAAAIDELLADPDRARAMGEAGRRRVREQFSAEAAGRRVLQLYAS
ncbi:MAG TPA: glycosyltransferase [Gaiellaceae bacterium]|nr:glycosyltransferase [Gaiellaceae bacterium]